MKDNQQDTPPSSLNGDEISGMENEMYIFEEVEEINLDDDFMETDGDGDMEFEEREPPEDHATLVFNKHVGSVFCCDLYPNGKIAVTGGEDDKAYVWSVETGTVIFDCIGHKDSIVFVGFSFDGAYLATADMGGSIKVWKVNLEENQQEPWPVVFEHEVDDISWGLWHFGARVLLIGVDSGDIYMTKIPTGETKILKGHNCKMECGKIFSDGVRLAAGYDDGAVKIWDLKTGAVINQIPANVHQTRVTAVDTHPEGNLMASISTDGKIVISTPNNGKIVNQLEAGSDLEQIAFSQDPVGYFATGTLNGAIGIWDVARMMVRHQCVEASDEAEGVTKMLWSKNYLLTGLLDGSIRIYEGRSGQLAQTITGHTSAILDLCYSAQHNIILTASDDYTARIFKYEVKKDND